MRIKREADKLKEAGIHSAYGKTYDRMMDVDRRVNGKLPKSTKDWIARTVADVKVCRQFAPSWSRLLFFFSYLFFFFSFFLLLFSFFFPSSHFTCSFFMHDCIATTNTTRTTPWNTMLQVIWTLYSQIPALASQQAVMKVRKSSAIPLFFCRPPHLFLFFFSPSPEIDLTFS